MDSTKQNTLKSPLSLIHYTSLVFLGVLFNFFLMVILFFFLSPSQFNRQGTDWFKISIWLLVPIIGSFFICFLMSIKTPRRITVSPIYVVTFTVLPALVLGAYVEYTVNFMFPETIRMNLVINHFLLTIIVYLFLIYSTGLFTHPIIRSLVGAFAERSNIQSGTKFYETSMSIKHILNEIENKKWLSELCSLGIVDKKEEEERVRLKLNKYNTIFYLALYAKKIGSKTLVCLTPYELEENLAKKSILVSEDSEYYLQPQIEKIEESLKLETISPEASEIIYDSVNYAMSPARFPMIVKYRNQFMVAAIASFFSILTVLAYSAKLIPVEILVGVIAMIVAIGSSAINMLTRK